MSLSQCHPLPNPTIYFIQINFNMTHLAHKIQGYRIKMERTDKNEENMCHEGMSISMHLNKRLNLG
jgi:hypothetical protein